MSRTSRNSAAAPTEAITLASVIGALLRDLGEAQRTANAHAAAHAGAETTTSVALLDSVEIELPFAIERAATRSVPAPRPKLTPASLQPFAASFAQTISRLAADVIRSVPDSSAVIDNLTSRDFLDHLAQKIADSAAGTSPADGEIAGILRGVVTCELLDVQSVAQLLPQGNAARARLDEQIAAETRRGADRVLEILRGSEVAATASEVEVIVDSAGVARSAPERLARIRLKARVDNDRWIASVGGA